MRWNVDFEIASIVYQLVFFCFFLTKKHLGTRQNRIYIATVVISFLSLSMDFATAYTNSFPQHFDRLFLTGVNLVFFLLTPLLSFCFFLYTLTVTRFFSFTKKSIFAAFLIPVCVAELVTLSTPVTGFVFYFDEGHRYHHGSGFVIQLAPALFYVMMSMVFIIRRRKLVSTLEKVSLCFMCIALVSGGLIQFLLFPDMLIIHFMTTLTLMTIYLSLENPDIYLDKTSGMFNREAFKAMTEEFISEGKSFSCIYLEVMDHKSLDAVYGTDNMEAVKRDVIGYIRKVFADKRIYRLGGLSYVIQESASGDFEDVVNTLRERFKRPFRGGSEEILLEACVLVIPYWHMPRDFSTIETIHTFALNMALAGTGTDVIRVDDSLIEHMEYERKVEHAIENAITTGSIQIYFQPIYSAKTSLIDSCEALSRLFDEDVGFIPPEVFIKKAEETGSIVNLGTQIFEKVCIFIRDHKLQQYGIKRIHVNLSPVQFKQESLAPELIELTKRYGVDRSTIVLEITETAAVEGSKIIRGNMDRLIQAGFSFSLDDYGTGFSNTASIIQLPFASVKIDKSLLWAYFNRQSNILPDLINMFIHQKLELIAEGVETREMVDALVEMRCLGMQGYYFSKPLPDREFISYVWEFNKQ